LWGRAIVDHIQALPSATLVEDHTTDVMSWLDLRKLWVCAILPIFSPEYVFIGSWTTSGAFNAFNPEVSPSSRLLSDSWESGLKASRLRIGVFEHHRRWCAKSGIRTFLLASRTLSSPMSSLGTVFFQHPKSVISGFVLL
jgi:hypothetical protein